jgi:hypothetical protein
MPPPSIKLMAPSPAKAKEPDMRNLNVGGNQGRGDPPAFNTELHRVTRQEPPSEAETDRSDTIGRVVLWIFFAAAALAAILAPIPFGGTP